MKVCYVFWRNSYGGLEKINRMYHDFLTEDRKFNISSFFFILKPLGFYGFFKEKDTSVHYGANNTFVAAIKYLIFLVKNSFDVIHLSNAGAFILLISSIKCHRIIYHIHGTIYTNNKRKIFFENFIWRHLVRKKNLFLIANSKVSKISFKQHFGDTFKISVLYNPIDTERFEFVGKQTDKVSTLFYIGRFSKGKNLVQWLDISIELNKRFEISFYLIGDGPEKNTLINKLNTSGYESNYILDFTNEPEKVYHRYDILLFLSLHESFGNVIIESLLCGTPVLALDIPVMQELLKDFPDFLVCQKKDLFNQISSKIEDYVKLVSMAKKASEYFRRNFSLESHFSRLFEFYKGK